MSKKYSKEQIDWLRENAPGNYGEDVVSMFLELWPESEMTTIKMKSLLSNYKIRLGIGKGHKPKWNKEHFQFLREFVPGHSEKEIQKALEDKFGIKTSIGNIGNLKNMAGVKSGTIGGQFQKGQVSWNKGKKWSEFMSEEGRKNSLKTCFKKGNVPSNHKPIGYERVDIEGYVYVKVQDLHQNRNFRQKHYLVWEQHYGPVPKGYQLRFLDGNRQNCDISNLALVSNAEKVYLNRMTKTTDPELHKSQILIAKLIDTTNKRKNKKQKRSAMTEEEIQACRLFDITREELQVNL